MNCSIYIFFYFPQYFDQPTNAVSITGGEYQEFIGGTASQNTTVTVEPADASTTRPQLGSTNDNMMYSSDEGIPGEDITCTCTQLCTLYVHMYLCQYTTK